MKSTIRLSNGLASVLCFAAFSVFAVEQEFSQSGDYSSVLSLFLFLGSILLVGSLIVAGLTRWSRKQDEINAMMYFCFDFLVNQEDEAERQKAARALGKAKMPEAVLVLLDVANDETVEESVRQAADGALREMSENYDRYRKVIDALLKATEKKDHERIVELLIKNFEQGRDRYVQSAYLIGRELFKLGQYSDAREWLRKAEFRNQELPVYLRHIKDFIALCSQRLFEHGDAAFWKGDYHSAKEHFALASHGLSDEASNQFSYFLRAACVYYKIGDLSNARQSILQALHHQQRTDTALKMNQRVDDLVALKNVGNEGEPAYQRIEQELDQLVDEFMMASAIEESA